MVDAKSMDLEPRRNNSFFAVGKSADHPNKNKIQMVTVIPNDLYTVDGTLLVEGTSVGCTSTFSKTISEEEVGCGWRALYRGDDGGVGAIIVKVTSRCRTDNPCIGRVRPIGRNAAVPDIIQITRRGVMIVTPNRASFKVPFFFGYISSLEN